MGSSLRFLYDGISERKPVLFSYGTPAKARIPNNETKGGGGMDSDGNPRRYRASRAAGPNAPRPML